MTHQLRLFDFDEAELLEAMQAQATEERALSAATVQAQSAKERLKLCTTAYEEACKRVCRLTHEATMKTAKIQDLEQVEGEIVEDADVSGDEESAESDSRSIVLMQRDSGGLRMGEAQPELPPSDNEPADTALVETGRGR